MQSYFEVEASLFYHKTDMRNDKSNVLRIYES
jgi:hypothetical protein